MPETKNGCLVVLFLLFLITNGVFSQVHSISGNVIDEKDQSPLSSATVYAETISDSTLLDYSITDFDGEFEISVRTSEPRINLFITFNGYETLQQMVFLKDKDIQLKDLEMIPKVESLDEVQIVGRSAPVSIKGDTLEFNASSFKTRKDANLEDLLRELPGVEVDGGNITVNGQTVNKILINGTEFFENDLKIATKNLPKNIIDKVQVVDSKTDLEEFTGKKASSNNKDINITLKEDSNSGMNARAIAGYGTDERYQLNSIVNFFKDKKRLTVLAGANNINNPGFSFDEVYDMIGNQQSQEQENEESFNLDNISFGSDEGITESQNAGANYSNTFGNDSQLTGNYFYGGSNTFNRTRIYRQNILPNNFYILNSTTNFDGGNDSHRFNAKYKFNVDSTLLVTIQPKFTYTKSHSSIDKTEEVSGLENTQSSSVLDQFNYGDIKNFSNKLNLVKNLNSRGSFLNLGISLETSENNKNSDYNSILQSSANIIDNIDQRREGNEKRNHFLIQSEYRMVVGKNFFIDYKVDYSRRKNENRTLVFDNENNIGASYLDNLSSNFSFDNSQLLPQIGLSIDKEKFNLTFGSRYNYLKSSKRDKIQNLKAEENHKFFTFLGNFRYQFNKFTKLYLTYDTQNQFPTLTQLQPIQDIRNPLNFFQGNPDLKPEIEHRFRANFTRFNFKSKTNIIFFGQGDFTKDKIINDIYTTEDLRSTISYLNNSDNYNIIGGVGLIKDFEGNNSSSNFKIDTGIGTSFRQAVNFVNGFGLKTNIQSLMPRFGVEYRFKNLLEIEPSYKISFVKTRYNGNFYEDNNFVVHNLELTATTYFPSSLTWGNDISYNYNGSINNRFDNSSIIWNMSLGVDMLKEKGNLKITAFDLLNQYVDTQRITNGNFIQDIQNTVLTQYFMFSLSYNIDTLKN